MSCIVAVNHAIPSGGFHIIMGKQMVVHHNKNKGKYETGRQAGARSRHKLCHSLSVRQLGGQQKQRQASDPHQPSSQPELSRVPSARLKRELPRLY